MRLPRWFAHLRADLTGYFWLPCPICKEEFAGFEMGPLGWFEPGPLGWFVDQPLGKTICNKPACAQKAKEQYEKLRHVALG